jgi:predicted nucleotidyltransferase
MKPTLLNFSDKPELALRAQMIGDFNTATTQTKAQTTIVGAFARDLLLRYRYGIDTIRSTEDVDLATVWRAGARTTA